MRCSISLFVRHACLVTCALILIDCHAAHAKDAIDLERFRPSAIARWEQAMVDFDQKNDAETHPDDSILFVGSSSIVRWDHISTDVVPYHAIQRGFGGSRWSDVAVYAERLIKPHKFRAVVFFVANDITGGDNDRTPAEVLALFAHVRDVVRVHNPDAPVFYIAVTPTESRWDVWPTIRAGNSAVRVCANTDATYFIGTESLFLNDAGRPRPELFVGDRLHLSRDGYILWNAAIKSHLDTVLNGTAVRRQ